MSQLSVIGLLTPDFCQLHRCHPDRVLSNRRLTRFTFNTGVNRLVLEPIGKHDDEQQTAIGFHSHAPCLDITANARIEHNKGLPPDHQPGFQAIGCACVHAADSETRHCVCAIPTDPEQLNNRDKHQN